MAKSASEEIAARRLKYNTLEFATDSLGRVIGVSQLRPSEQVRLQEWTPGLSGMTPVTEDDPKSENYGKTYQISQRAPLMIAASVRQIDDAKFGFPKSRSELDAVFDRLDDEGIAGAAEALGKFQKKEDKKAEDGEETVPPETAAKN